MLCSLYSISDKESPGVCEGASVSNVTCIDLIIAFEMAATNISLTPSIHTIQNSLPFQCNAGAKIIHAAPLFPLPLCKETSNHY